MDAKAFGFLFTGILICSIFAPVLFFWFFWSGYGGGVDWGVTNILSVIFLLIGIVLICAGLNSWFNEWFEAEDQTRHPPCPRCGTTLGYFPDEDRYYCRSCAKSFRPKK